MPISQFSEGLRKVISLLPGTYGTSLMRNHATLGAFAEMGKIGVPDGIIEEMKSMIDCNIYFFGEKVEISTMYMVLGETIQAFIAIYIGLNICKIRKVK